jgi:hypothetical protein
MPDGHRFPGADRPDGGSFARFKPYTHGAPPAREQAKLRADHAALRDARTVFPTRVFNPTGRTVLISGHNNAKTGRVVTRGPWKGCEIYTVTLEERATCPTSCHLLAECYGNAMPLAKRWREGPEFIKALDQDLRRKAAMHPKGFAVRTHVLGDFYSEEYSWAWLAWVDAIKPLHVWGYTAHTPDSAIGQILGMGNDRFPDRFRIRFSGDPSLPRDGLQATTIWRSPEGDRVAEGLICPAQTDKTKGCGTCGLCWSRSMDEERIVFIGHGRRSRKGQPNRAAQEAKTPIRQATGQELRLTIALDEQTLTAIKDIVAQFLRR